MLIHICYLDLAEEGDFSISIQRLDWWGLLCKDVQTWKYVYFVNQGADVQEEAHTPDEVIQAQQWDTTKESMDNYLRGFRDYDKSKWF